MKAGRLDRRITIEQPSTSQDSLGEEVTTWSTFATAWADRIDMRGRERFDADQDIATRIATFRLRWLAGVTDEMRIQDEGAAWYVTGVAGDEREGWLELTAEAQNAVGTGS